MGHEATAIDLDAGAVEVRDPDDGTYRLGYDHLLIATGGTPIRPDAARHRPAVRARRPDARRRRRTCCATPRSWRRLPAHRRGRQRLHRPRDGRGLRATVGARVTVVEQAAQPMGTLDPDMGDLVAEAPCVSMGVTLRTRRGGDRVRARRRADHGRAAAGRTSWCSASASVRTRRWPSEAGLEPRGRRTPSGSTSARRRRARACGRPVTAARAATWSPVSPCTSPSAPTPTSRAGWPASTSAAGDAVFPGVLGTAITQDLPTRRSPGPGWARARPRRPGSTWWRAGIEATTDGRLLPGRRADDGEADRRTGLGPAARRPDRRVAPARPSASTPAPRPSPPA